MLGIIRKQRSFMGFAGAEVERYKAEMMKDPKFAQQMEAIR